MTHKFAFRLASGNAPNRYVIELTDRQQIAALVLGEGLKKSAGVAPIAVDYDEGNRELVLAEGFDDKSARGRIAMMVLAGVYCDLLAQITARKESSREPSGRAEYRSAVFLFQ